MSMQYKCYALDKINGSVYGIITENDNMVGFHQMQNYQNKLIPIQGKGNVNYERKGIFKEGNYDFTTSAEEAFAHMKYYGEKRKAKRL